MQPCQGQSFSAVMLEQGLFSAVQEKSVCCNARICSVGKSPQHGFIFSFPAKVLSSPCFSSEIAGKPSAWQLWVRWFRILWRSHSQARIVGSGSSSGQRNRNSTTLFWLWFASYESDDQMISHHCYIRNIRSLLRKLLKQVVSER